MTPRVLLESLEFNINYLHSWKHIAEVIFNARSSLDLSKIPDLGNNKYINKSVMNE